MDRFLALWLALILLSSGALADAEGDSALIEHRVPRVSGRIVKVYSGNRPEPYLCNSEGYKADPHSCASFYRCVKERSGKLNVFRYQCAPGTVYDPDLETCNHPRSTRRSECGGMKQAATTDSALVNDIDIKKELPRPINTNKLAFQQSTVNAGSVIKAEATWLASATTQMPFETTILLYPFTSAAYLSDATKQNHGYNVAEPESTSWTSNKQESNWGKTTSRPTVSNSRNNDICSDDGFTGDIDNCRKFYRCVENQKGGFLKYEFFCSESTIWDEQIQSCNHPWAVKRSKCGRSLPLVSKFTFTETSKITTAATAPVTTPKSSTTTSKLRQKTKTIQQQLQISHGSNVTQTQTQISHSDQVIQNQTQINYGDRKTQNNVSESKQNQTQIAHGSAVSQTQTQIDYGTKGVQTQLQIDHSKDSSQSQMQIQESTTTQGTPSNQNNQCSKSGFMGDYNDCKKFYRCVDNGRGSFTKYEYKCGEGTVWDQSIDACNHAWAVKECGGQSHLDSQPPSTVKSTTYREDITTTTPKTTQSTSETSETDVDSNDVGYGNQEETPVSTTKKPHYQTTKDPQYQTTKESQTESNNNNECKSSGFMGDVNNCKKFYRCVDNGMGGYTRYEFTCGEGTVWDTSIEACNHAWAVKSCGESGVSNQGSQSSEPTTTFEETTTSTARPVDKTTNNNDEPIRSTTTEGSTSTTMDTLPNTENKCIQSGFMGDNQNCKKFYRCVDNGDGTYTRYDFTCGEGTVWDYKIEACNHEWAVEKCGKNEVSSTSSDSTTSKQPTLQDEDNDNDPTTENNESSSTTQHISTTTVKNVVIASDQECTRGGFIGDKNDCKKFYRCVENNSGGYDRYQFSCGEGTVWDDSILACNHAWAVKNCGASGTDTSQSYGESTEGTSSATETENQKPAQLTTEKITSTTGHLTENEVFEGDCKSEGFYGSSIDCKKFIRCVDDGQGSFTKYEFTCGEGTTWNQNIVACDHPSPDRPCNQNHQSTTKTSPINDEMITESTTIPDTSTSSSDKEESQQTQKPQQTQQSSGKCESEGFYGDPSNCKKFYRCVDDGKGGYTKYDFSCGDGTIWNQDIVACDHESDDKSCLSSAASTEESSSQSQSTTSKSPSDSTTSSSTISHIQGPDKTESPSPIDTCTSEGFFPHSHDCKKFVRCVNNGDGDYTRFEFSCGQGTVWVQEIQTCDHDNGQSTCSQQSETSTKPQDSGTSSSSITESTSTNSENLTQNKEDDEYPDQTTKQPSNVESSKCTSEGYYGNKNDCRKFYRCVDNGDGSYTKYDFECGEGTAWDSSIDSCNHIHEVETCSEINKGENQTQQTMKDEEVSQTTEGTSSTTKETNSSSESSEEPGSGSNNGSEDKCESEGYYGDSKDCKKFYRCVDNGKGGFTKYDFTCGEGTIWDQDITNCNHPQDVNNPSCKSSEDNQSPSTGSSTSSTTSAPESTSSSSTTNNSSSTQSSSNCSQEESSKKPDSSKDIICDKAGYYPNQNDCKKFYRCVDWDGDGKRFSVYHFECGEGTIWDPALDTCNHEESVYPPRDCSQTQSQNETSEGTTQKQEETTTVESSTTQESTTNEQTTTEKEETTTQQATTSEKTTTEQSTTSEQTTTQQSTTKTTTQKSTTSEQTTTQQSTTSDTITTQESTTSEQTTTQQSTSEQTTTQQSTTNEQTTTQQSTSEQTTQESTTSDQTTQESTTSEQTTQEKPTSEQTTQEQTTTQASTEQTDSSNTDGTTESTTTESENNSTTEQSSTTEGEQGSTESSSDKECPDTDDDQYLLVCPTSFKRHPKYCNMFYQCKEDEDTHEVNVATFKCPNETIYDESQTKCVEEKEADKKCDGEMARRHRFKRLHKDSKEPITVDKESKSCPKEGYYAFEKNVECSNGFMKCEKSKSGKIRGYVHQCPEGFIFWAISKRCELGRNIRDCKRSSNDWTGRRNIPIDRKNIAF